MKKRHPIPEMGELFTFPPVTEPGEPAHSTQPPDWSEREQALDVTRSWIVEAPAGSGKTGLLIQRYLKLLALPGVEQPEQVLAITFTIKATGEIRERILGQLERAASSDSPSDNFDRETLALADAVLQRDRALGWNLLHHPRRLNVRTIDSICAEIARGLPLLSGGSGLSPVEDATALYQLAAERTLMQLGGSDAALSHALRLLLLHRDGNLAQLRDLIGEMLALRDQWGRLVPLGHEMLEDAYLDGTVLSQIERTLADAVCAELTRFSATMPGDVLRELSTLAGELGHNEGYRRQPSPIAVCAGIYDAPAEEASHLAHWRALIHLLVTRKNEWRSSFNDNHLGLITDGQQKARLQNIVDRLRGRGDLLAAFKRVNALPPAVYPPEQWQVAKALFRVLYRALAELQVVFAERGECDFTEPGLLARTALRRDGAVLETAMGTHLQHLLVDEMQDTSTSQYELIQLLTQGWDGRSQTVFLVGDPKQSIYLFRQARVERFIRTMKQQRLGELELGCLRLTANFRSQRDLVNSFNQDFSLLFPPEIDDDHPEEVPYVAAEPVRDPTGNGARAVVWHPQVLPAGLSPEEKRATQRRQARTEALHVRRVIEDWRARPKFGNPNDPWKIAVLVRNRKHLADIVAELKRDAGSGAIPFRAVNIESLSERQEILDLFALTRSLLHPADRAAWLAVLRAPWCGLELAELYTLTGADDPALYEHTLEELLAQRGHELNEQSCARLERLWTVLRAAATQHSRLSVAEQVERTWRSIGGDAYLTPVEKTNARRYFELLDTLEQKTGAIDLAQLKHRLGELYAESAPSPGAVDLITIHGSKGLEWDVVLVPGLGKKSGTSHRRLLTWNEMPSQDEDAAQVLLAPIAGKGRDSEALNLWLHQIQRTREQAECRRLFYVASTRAREELHLFATPAEKTNGSIFLAPDSLLHATWSAAERHFVNTQVSAKPLIAPVVPLRPAAPESLVLPGLAAEGEEISATTLRRLPHDFRVHGRFQPAVTIPRNTTPFTASGARFERPEGSFEARAFGSAVHALFESLAARIAGGIAPSSLVEETASWGPRVSAILRSTGLSPQTVERHVPRVKAALEMALKDPHGLWVLSAHKDAVSEQALTSWDELRSNVRLDRVFHAGPVPFAPGNDHLWIVDFKTAQHKGEGLEAFLFGEREKYSPQMETYARMMHRSTGGSIRLGLYYPLLPRLIWWTFGTD